MRETKFSEAMSSPRAVLIVRCGGGYGKCGRAQAVVFEDRTVQLANRTCHAFDKDFYLDQAVRDEFTAARTAWERAQRAGRPHRPASMTYRPIPRQVRPDREIHYEDDWTGFVAMLEANGPPKKTKGSPNVPRVVE
jgi:hypothetical protein